MSRILAVDDDNSMTVYYTALFEEAGYEVSTASDATAALMKFRDFKPDLVVLDAEIPAGGGEMVFEMTREVLGSSVPIVFVTGLPERVLNFALTKSNTRVFKKPVKSEELLSAVAKLLCIR